MLNLQELERKLDEALAEETSESLTSWLLSQRNNAPVRRVVDAIDLVTVQEQFTPQRSGQAKFSIPKEETAGLYNYVMAA